MKKKILIGFSLMLLTLFNLPIDQHEIHAMESTSSVVYSGEIDSIVYQSDTDDFDVTFSVYITPNTETIAGIYCTAVELNFMESESFQILNIGTDNANYDYWLYDSSTATETKKTLYIQMKEGKTYQDAGTFHLNISAYGIRYEAMANSRFFFRLSPVSNELVIPSFGTIPRGMDTKYFKKSDPNIIGTPQYNVDNQRLYKVCYPKLPNVNINYHYIGEVPTNSILPSSEEFVFGSEHNVANIPEIPDGYQFLGWFQDEEGVIPYQKTDVLKNSITVYGKWKKLVIPTPNPDEDLDNLKPDTPLSKPEIKPNPVLPDFIPTPSIPNPSTAPTPTTIKKKVVRFRVVERDKSNSYLNNEGESVQTSDTESLNLWILCMIESLYMLAILYLLKIKKKFCNISK